MSKYKLFINGVNNLNKELIADKILRITKEEFNSKWTIVGSLSLTTKKDKEFNEYNIKCNKYNTFIIYSDSKSMFDILNEFSKEYSCIMIIDDVKFVCGGSSKEEIKLLEILPNELNEEDICVGMKVANKIVNKFKEVNL